MPNHRRKLSEHKLQMKCKLFGGITFHLWTSVVVDWRRGFAVSEQYYLIASVIHRLRFLWNISHGRCPSQIMQ
jgi:hypothetical protein